MWWRATEESPRMFDADFIDAFSRVPWWMVPAVFVPITIGLVAAGVAQGTPWWAVVPLFVAGWLVWTLTEYWLHRTLFHWVPDASWGERFHFFLHGVHHQWFQDRLRLVMPPAASLFLGVIFFGLYWGIAQALAPLGVEPWWFWAFYAGKVAGYMNYDLTHYYIHHGKPSLSFYKELRHHHNSHHHAAKYKELRFGVSTRIWDHVFGTMEPRS